MQARKSITSSATAYFALVIEDSISSKEIQGVPIVDDYPEIFTDDLPSLSLEKEIEFVIELEPIMTPIHRALDHMAPLELKKLKEQIEELLEKGIIRPNSSL